MIPEKFFFGDIKINIKIISGIESVNGLETLESGYAYISDSSKADSERRFSPDCQLSDFATVHPTRSSNVHTYKKILDKNVF
jgi:hypothetical protein